MKYKANPIALKWYNVLKDSPVGVTINWKRGSRTASLDKRIHEGSVFWVMSDYFTPAPLDDSCGESNFEKFFNKLYEEEEFNGLIPLTDNDFVYIEDFYIDGGAYVHHALSMKNVDDRANCWSFDVSKEYDDWMTRIESDLTIDDFDSDKFYSFEGNVFIQDGQWAAIVVVYMQSNSPLSWEEHFYFPLNDVKYEAKYENCIAVHKKYLAPLGQWIHDVCKGLIK